MTISVGDIVTVTQAGDVLWSVMAELPDGLWHLTREPDVGLDAAESDITMVIPVTVAPGVVSPGAMVVCRQTGAILYVVVSDGACMPSASTRAEGWTSLGAPPAPAISS